MSDKPCPFCHPNPKNVFHTGTDRDEARQNMQKAIEMRLEGMKEDTPIPEPSSSAHIVVIP